MQPSVSSRNVTFTVVILLAAACSLAAETLAPGRVSGVVRDRTGGIVAAATVTIRGDAVAEPLTTVTDGEGRFAFPAVLPGRYQASAVAPGFRRTVQEEVVVQQDGEAVITLTLEVAETQVVVEVTAPVATTPLRVETDPRQPRQPIPAHDGADYLKTIPGFSVIRKGGTDGDPVLRGMAGSRLGILLDGEHILGGCGNRMDPPTAYTFPEAFDRITVLKGPQTVAHGPGNSAGVVLFERDRETIPGMRVLGSVTFGSFGRNDQIGDLKVMGRSAYVRASATRSAMDDYEDGSGRAVHARYERWSSNAMFGWTPRETTRIEFSSAFSDGQAAYADRTMDGVKFARQNAGVRLEQRNLSRVVQTLDAQAFYNYVDHVMDNYTLRTFKPSMTMPGPSAANPDRQTIGGRIAAGLRYSSSGSVTLGVDAQSNIHTIRRSTNQTADPFETHARVRDAEFDNVGVFGELTQSLGARQRVIAGARIDRWAGRDDRATITVGMGGPAANPTAGVRRQESLAGGFGRYELAIDEAATIYAGLGHIERAPDYWELISKESTGSLSAFNTRPEKTTQLDAGVLYRRGALSGSASLFVNEISDFILIQSNYAKPAGMGSRMATVARNLDASSWGGEASLTVAVVSRLKLDTSISYVRGENDTDSRPLAQLPPLEGRVGLQYSADRWSLGALTRLVAAQDRFALNQGNIVGQDLGPTASFAVFSMNGSARVYRLVHVSAGVDNLFDATYSEFVSRGGAAVPGFTTTTRVNEPGRTLWIKMDIRH